MTDEQNKPEEVEGQGIRWESEDKPEDASDSDAEVTENATEGGAIEVEGQPIKWGEPAKDVEGQGFRMGDKADKAAKPDSGKDKDDPEVEGQSTRWG